MPNAIQIQQFADDLAKSNNFPKGEYLWSGAGVSIKSAAVRREHTTADYPYGVHLHSNQADCVSDVFWHVKDRAIRFEMYDGINKHYFFQTLAESAFDVLAGEHEGLVLQHQILCAFSQRLIHSGEY